MSDITSELLNVLQGFLLVLMIWRMIAGKDLEKRLIKKAQQTLKLIARYKDLGGLAEIASNILQRVIQHQVSDTQLMNLQKFVEREIMGVKE
jgi:hypothetical protein